MSQHSKRLFHSVMIILMAAVLCVAAGDAASVKKAGKKAVQNRAIADIPRKRIVKEFTDAYQSPSGSSVIRAYHTGKSRKGFRIRGEQRVPVQVHRVALEVKLTDCGIKMRDIWEVNFYRLETNWIFDGILQISSSQLTWPKKKLPALDNAAVKKLLAGGIMEQYPESRVVEVTILEKKAAWRLCTPQYRVKSKVLLTMNNDVYSTVTSYECLTASTISYREVAWVHDASGCVYRGTEVNDCHIGTMCRQLSAESAIPPVSDGMAISLLRAAFENEYGLKKNNIIVEEFEITGRQPAENFGKTIPVVMRARFVIDEWRENAGTPRSATAVRAAYECFVYGSLTYSAGKDGWAANIDSCCASKSEQCGRSCSTPVKGCRRLGEK